MPFYKLHVMKLFYKVRMALLDITQLIKKVDE